MALNKTTPVSHAVKSPFGDSVQQFGPDQNDESVAKESDDRRLLEPRGNDEIREPHTGDDAGDGRISDSEKTGDIASLPVIL